MIRRRRKKKNYDVFSPIVHTKIKAKGDRFHRNRRSFSEIAEKLSTRLSRDIGSNPNQGMKSHLIAVASICSTLDPMPQL